jgi:hypothetical protein
MKREKLTIEDHKKVGEHFRQVAAYLDAIFHVINGKVPLKVVDQLCTFHPIDKHVSKLKSDLEDLMYKELKPHITLAELPALLKAIDIACQEVYDERLQWLLRWRLRLGPTDPDISYEIQEFGKAFAFGEVCTQPVADAFEEYIDHAIHGKEREWETRKREEIMRLMLDLERQREPAKQ